MGQFNLFRQNMSVHIPRDSHWSINTNFIKTTPSDRVTHKLLIILQRDDGQWIDYQLDSSGKIYSVVRSEDFFSMPLIESLYLTYKSTTPQEDSLPFVHVPTTLLKDLTLFQRIYSNVNVNVNEIKALPFKSNLHQYGVILLIDQQGHQLALSSIEKQHLEQLHTYIVKAEQLIEANVMDHVSTDVNHSPSVKHEIPINKELLHDHIFHYAKEGIVILDLKGVILDANKTFLDMMGFSVDVIHQQEPRFLRQYFQSTHLYDDISTHLSQNQEWVGEVLVYDMSHFLLPLSVTVSGVYNEANQLIGYVFHCCDLSMQKAYEVRLMYENSYDELTGLPNQTLLLEQLRQRMTDVEHTNLQLLVIYLDIDEFKQIYNVYGREVSDEALVILSQHVNAHLNEQDLFARVGGDEFIIVKSIEKDSNWSLPINALMSIIHQPFKLGLDTVCVNVSAGVCLYPQHQPTEPEQLLRQADQALYQSKVEGKNRFTLFDTQHDHAMRQLYLHATDVARGIQHDEFVLFYQPKVQLKTGRVVGAEALIRWQHPEKGLLQPFDFLPCIHNHSVMIELGEWVIERALRDLYHWQQQNFNLKISVNIDAIQLQHPDFLKRLSTILDKYHYVNIKNYLFFEILETSLLLDIDVSKGVILACQDLGISFALDDFGTGYSSLTYLRQLPITHLKIDKSFIMNMLRQSEDVSMLQGIMVLTRIFKKITIAEGIEEEGHGEVLIALGCEQGQGYFIARPMPFDEFVPWMCSYQPPKSWLNTPQLHTDNVLVVFIFVWYRALLVRFQELFQEKMTLNDIRLLPNNSFFTEWLEVIGKAQYANHILFEGVFVGYHQMHHLSHAVVDYWQEQDYIGAHKAFDALKEACCKTELLTYKMLSYTPMLNHIKSIDIMDYSI